MKKMIFLVILTTLFISYNWGYGEEIVPIPEWKEGYFWTFDIRGPKGKVAEITWIVTGEDRLEDKVCYTVKVEKKREGGTDEWTEYFEKQTGMYLGHLPARAEKFRKANVDTQGFYRFPYKVGDKWNLRWDVNTWANFKVDKKIHKITTPVREFDTLRVSLTYELTGGRTGRNWSKRWYSPLVKNYVKIINHRETDFTELILTNYKAD